MLIRLICFITIFSIGLFPTFLGATKITCEPMEELLKEADFVALVRIDAGETLFSGEKVCGARYRSQVIDGIKGSKAGESLEWCTSTQSANNNLEIGTSYLIFLIKPERSYDPWASTNSASRRRASEFEKDCGLVLQNNHVIHSGNGALKVEVPMLGRSSSMLTWDEEIVRIPGMAIRIPDSLKTQPVMEAGQEVFANRDVWVRLSELVCYLKTRKP